MLAVRKERCLRMAFTDQELIQMALIGYEVKRAEIEAKIAEIQADLGGSSKRAMTSGATARAKPERLTAAARKRIAAAQKKRWAAFRAAKEAEASEAAKKAAPKRKLSADAQSKLVAKLAKARAARAAKKVATETLPA